MLIVRVIAAVAKPALVGGTLAATAAGGWFAIDRLNGDEPTPFQQVQSAGPRLIISEFGEASDAIVAVDPDDVDSRTTIANVAHAEGYGIFPSLSPDGDAIAYTALPPGSPEPSPGAPAVAGIVDAGGDVTALADDVDLLIAPVWSPDGTSIVVRKNTPAEDAAGAFELLLLGRDGSRSTITTWTTRAAFPIAFAPDGSKLYFATLSPAGTDLYSVSPDGSAETLIAHLSDEVARDWKLSPDGSTLAYSVALAGPDPRISTMTLDLATGVAAEAGASVDAEYSPAWTADGALTVASVDPLGRGAGVTVDAPAGSFMISTGASRIDLPLAWSPDGATLAVRSVQGASPLEPGPSYVELVDASGGRERVSDNSDVLIVGWLE